MQAERPTESCFLGAKEREEKEQVLNLVRRPNTGVVGRGVTLKTNYFAVTNLPSGDIFHYDITISPEVPKSLNRVIFNAMVEKYHGSHFNNVAMAFDGRANIYTPVQLAQEVIELEVNLEPANTRREPRVFRAKIKRANVINMEMIKKYLDGQLQYTPHETLQALEVILRQSPASRYTTVGRNFFGGQDIVKIPGGVEVWKGIFQSIKATRGRLLLNGDISATTFFQSGNMVDVLSDFFGKAAGGVTSLSDQEKRKFESFCRGLKVIAVHAQNKRKYKVLQLTPTSAEQTTFQLEDGSQISVAEYFFRQYQIRLKYPKLPCLKVGNPVKNVFLPMECCDILKGQRYPKKCNEDQTAAMIKITCVKPEDRMREITRGISSMNVTQNEVLDAFQIKIGNEILQVNGRVLDTPTVYYGQQSREKTITPRDGAWNLMNKCVDVGVTVKSWAVLCFGNYPKNAVYKFIDELVETCTATGLTFEGPAREPPVLDARDEVDVAVKKAYAEAEKACQAPPQFILCILPSAGSFPYGEIKRTSDTIIGLPSQCMQSKHMFQAKKSYCANLALKINVKLGGVNSHLGSQLKFIGEMPTIVFGADVTHPGIGADASKPSIAAVVASMDAKMSRYSSIVRCQEGRTEIIKDMQSIVVAHLKSFYQATSKKPMRILFYRDGVSDGQFAQVIENEVAAIKKACHSLDANYNPAITFIIVQKRHHTRFFPTSRDSADRSGNVLPGTVVDTGICNPSLFDFYLCSHAGIQGTSRPAHYHVVVDENKFGADAIQELSYRLCYTYARCTRSVSVVPPAYYAHLAAFRARLHFKYDDGGSVMSGSEGGAGVFTPVKAGLDRTMYFI